MSSFASSAASRARLSSLGHSVRVVGGVGERLPLADASADAIVCTLTLCSVRSPEAVLAEVRRVLKPRGTFLFVEHVLSPTDSGLRAQQVALTPLQVLQSPAISRMQPPICNLSSAISRMHVHLHKHLSSVNASPCPWIYPPLHRWRAPTVAVSTGAHWTRSEPRDSQQWTLRNLISAVSETQR